MWLLHIDSWQELVIGLAIRIFIIMCILPIHEYAHGWAANKLGDPTAKRMGRLTLNPMAHIDWIGAALIILVGFGWAKPVPVNPYNFTDRSHAKRSMALTALAGPASNVLVALAGMLLLRILSCFDIGSAHFQYYLTYAFYFIMYINISLAIFNLLPIYPLDGSRILGGILPDGFSDFMEKNGQIMSMVFIIVIFSGLLDGVLTFLIGGGTRLLFSGVNGLFDLIGLSAKGSFGQIFNIFGLLS